MSGIILEDRDAICIGGNNAGVRINSRLPSAHLYIDPREPVVPTDEAMRRLGIRSETYRREIIRAGDELIPVFVIDGLDMADAMRLVLREYAKSAMRLEKPLG